MRVSTLAWCCAGIAAGASCQRSARPSPAADTLLFQIQPVPGTGGARKAWIATYEAGGRTARFRIELTLKDAGSDVPFAFTEGALVREAGSDGTQLMQDLARALGGVKPPVGSNGVERLEVGAAILGRDLHRGKGSGNQYAGAFVSNPKGNWMVTKLFLGEGEGEVFLNLDPVGGWGEFAAKDPDYARDVLSELGRVFQGVAVAATNSTPAPASSPAADLPPPPDALALLRARLHEPDPARKAAALGDVRRLKDDADRAAVLPDVIALVEDDSVVVRGAALAALPELASSPGLARAAATAALRHPNPATQVMAARAIWKLGEANVALGYLIAFLEGDAREQAASVLGDMGAEAHAAIPRLTRMLDERHNGREGYAAAIALARMGSAAQPALPALRAAADDPDPTVSRAARYAVGVVQPK